MNTRLIAFAAVSLAFCTGVNAQEEFPKLKAGLWESSWTISGRPPLQSQMCVDDQTYSLMFKSGQSLQKKNCSRHSLKNLGGGKYVGDSVCQFGSRQATGHDEMTITGDSAYHVVHTTHWAPARPDGKSDTVDTGDSRWIGACAAGMRAGDMIMKPGPGMPNGMRINVLDAEKGQ